jgi:C-terminal processing protease CtpA/Prc
MKFLIPLGLWLAAGAAFAAATNDLPKFDEVYQLLRANLNGTSEADLNRAAVRGLLAQLSSDAMLVGVAEAGGETPDSPPLGKSIIYDNSYAYFRVLKVQTNLADKLMTVYREMAATNKSRIKGVVLDLRFAGGSDFPAAATAADCFLNSDQPLLECGGEVACATKKENAITVPLAVLINSKTSEAAEGLAAVLRETSTGLLLGGQTAGRASLFKEFPLADGGKLRIAVGEIKLGNGAVFSGGVKPDIAVDTNPAEEKAYWEEPYLSAAEPGKTSSAGTNTAAAGGSATNGAYRRFNEAELVREQREGADLEAEFNGRSRYQSDPGLAIIKDPVLARALDLLKGLSVVQQGHPG